MITEKPQIAEPSLWYCSSTLPEFMNPLPLKIFKNLAK